METTHQTATQTTTWSVDPTHSNVQFVARHMIISNVTGHFTDYTATVKTKGESIEGAEAEFEAKLDSISTGQPDRDNHLKSADFFDAANHPTIKFKTTSIEKAGADNYKVHGDLTMRGVTKPVTLEAEFTGKVNDPWGNERMAFEIRGSINRFDYGLQWNSLLETGGAVVGPNIKLKVDMEFVKQNS